MKAAKPVCVDLYCGLGGWAEGFLSEGYEVIGYDIEKHDYGTGGYPGKLVLRDVLRLNGAKVKRAAVIVASPPCQEPSYRAMPWSRAKALNDAGPPHKFIALFEACFRIQREASEAAGRYIPLVIENVRGAQVWVGPARWHFGSFYLWGDVPALMPITKHKKISGQNWSNFKETGEVSPHWRMEGIKVDGSVRDESYRLTEPRPEIKNSGGSWFGVAHNTTSGLNRNPDGRNDPRDRGTKVSGDWFGNYAETKAAGTISPGRLHGKNSSKRKAASALIAKIPFPLSSHIARCFKNGATHD